MVEPRACPWCSHNTSAAPERPFPEDVFQRAIDTLKSLGPHPPRVKFYAVPGSTDVAVVADDVPIKVLTAAQFEELKAKLEAP